MGSREPRDPAGLAPTAHSIFSMKAIQIHQHGGPDVLRLADAPDPEPAGDEVLVRLHAAGVNPVDTYLRAGSQGYDPELPFIPGMDGAGTVEAIGEAVTDLAAGDRVFVAGRAGCYAEKVAAPQWRVRRLADDVSFEAGACVGVPYATAYRALFQRARVAPGETVLVHGASGGVGTAAVQLAVAHGCIVIGTASTDEGWALVKGQGARYVLDHTQPDHLDAIEELTAGRGVDVVLEMASHVNLGIVLPHLAVAGRVVVIGSRGTVEVNPRDLMSREAAVLGMSLVAAPRRALEEAYLAIEARLDAGTIRPVVDRTYPLSEAAEAHRALGEDGARGHLVLEI